MTRLRQGSGGQADDRPDSSGQGPSDRDVVREVRRGDRDAFGHLVRTYQGRAFGLVLMMVREPAGAEEVTQDCFVRAYTHLDHYDDQRPFYPWLASIAVRLAQNWLRRHGRTAGGCGAPISSRACNSRRRG